MSKIFTTSDGRELKLGFSDDLDNHPEIKSAKLSLPKETEDLIQQLYKKDNKQNLVLEKTLKAYQKVVDQDSDNADLWLEQLQSQLKEKEKLTKERNNVFSNGDKAYDARNAAPIPTLEAIEGLESAIYLDPAQENAIDEKTGNLKTIRQFLREKAEIGAIKNKYIDRTLIKTIEATKLDVAADIDTNDRNIDHLLSGQILTPDQELRIRKDTELYKNHLAEVAEVMTGWLTKPRDPREVETSFFGGSIYKEIHKDLQNAILSNPALHPELSNPFLQRLNAEKRGAETLTPYEKELLKQYSDEEDKAHEAERRKRDEQLKEANEEFYKDLQKHSDKEQDMIPGRMLRMLLMANPFMGGILGGITLLGPLANILSGAMDFNDVVLSPIKFCFNLGKLGDLGVGDAIVGGLKTGIEESRIFNIPNSIVNLATDNSIAHSIFGSAGGAITGPIAQLGLAGVAMFYEADETLQFADEKDKTKTKFKEKFEKIHKDFAKNLDERRKNKIDQFAKKNAANIHENENLEEKLKPQAKELVDSLSGDASKEKALAKILAKKLGLKENEVDPSKLKEFLEEKLHKQDVKDLLLLHKIAKKDGKVDKLQQAFQSIEAYDAYLASKKDGLEKERKSFIPELYGLEENHTDSDLAKKRKEIAEKYKDNLTPYLNYALKEKPEKEVEGQDDAQAKKGKDTKKDHYDDLSSGAPSAPMPTTKTADPTPPIKPAINSNNNGGLSAQASVNQYSEASGISASAKVATGLPTVKTRGASLPERRFVDSITDERNIGGSALVSTGQVGTVKDPTKLPSKNKDGGRER